MRTSEDWHRFATPLGVIRLVLLVDWDPIGVLGYLLAMDEYDSYAVGVYDLLQSDASDETVMAHLRGIETKQMGVRGNPNLAVVVKKLRRAYERSCSGSSG